MAALPFNWGQYLGDGTATGGARDTTFTTQQGWDQALNWVRQFDKDASIQANTNGQEGQYIAFNNALLPQNAMGGNGIMGAVNLQALQDRGHYIGPQAQDQNLGQIGNSLYGQKTLTDRGTWLDIVGPLLVGGLAGLGGGGFNLISSLMQKAPGLLSQGNQFLNQGPSWANQQNTFWQQMLQGRGPGG